MTVKKHDCAHHGHIWLEDASGVPFIRHRGRKGLVPVHCQNCPKKVSIESHGAFTAPPGAHDVDHAIPAPFKKVLDRALKESPETTTTGPVEKPQ